VQYVHLIREEPGRVCGAAFGSTGNRLGTNGMFPLFLGHGESGMSGGSVRGVAEHCVTPRRLGRGVTFVAEVQMIEVLQHWR
jgi:hypothetical protein